MLTNTIEPTVAASTAFEGYRAIRVEGVAGNASEAYLSDTRFVALNNILWSHHGGVANVGGIVRGVNNHGQVVGNTNEAGVVRPFVWQQGQLSYLQPLVGSNPVGVAEDINDSGMIVGWMQGSPVPSISSPRPVVWMSSSALPDDLGTIGADGSGRGLFVNDAGEILAVSMPGVGSTFGHDLFIWQGGTIEMSWPASSAFAFNNSGVVLSDGLNRYTNGLLDPVPPSPLTDRFTMRAVNDSGWIAGDAFVPSGGGFDQRAALWNGIEWLMLEDHLADGEPRLDIVQAFDVNNAGDVLVRDASSRWYILTPIPEPDISVLMALFALGLAGSRKRR